MLHIDPLTARGAATALALEETLQQILGRRPDLQRSALLVGLHTVGRRLGRSLP